MRRIFTLILLLAIGFTGTYGQQDISIGTGTVGNTGTSYPCPLQDYFEGSRMQYLYRASELTAAGMSPGTITAIKWNVTALNGAGLIEKMSIRIGSTTVNTLSTAAWDPINNPVATAQVDYQPVVGINTFNLPSSFFWDGSSNIIVEVCNGEPGNATGTWWTNNPTIPWTTGLAFNGSHSLAQDNNGNLCGSATTTNSGTQTTRPNVTFAWTPAAACSGAPNGGTAVTTNNTLLCAGAQFTLSLTGATVASGLTYQWQSSVDNINFNNITGATSSSYITTQTAPSLYYRAIVTCAGQSNNSVAVLVTSNTLPVYVTLPYAESFENNWLSACGVRELPTANWRNTPVTGNNSWRRHDDGTAAAWTTVNGAYTPVSTAGNFSARFHSFNSTNGSKGQLDLYFNGNTTSLAKQVLFDFINTSGNDSLVVLLSTNGGASFLRLDSVRTAAQWRTKSVVFNTSSATSVLRFEATSDIGATDIGLDNIILITFADCVGTPVGGTTSTNKSTVCVGETFTLSFTGATSGNGIGYQWQSSTDNGTTWTNIVGATGLTYTGTQTVTTLYRVLVTCSFSSASAGSVPVVVNAPSPVIGSYTINNAAATNVPARTFNNFNDAYNFIKCGIAGPVVFNVLTGTGPYNEQLIMTAVPGATSTNTVTFKGNGVAAIQFASANTAERAVIKLRATKHIIFDSLVINCNTGTFGYGVQLINVAAGSGADSNIVRNCIINSSLTVSTSNFAGIVLSGSDTDPVAVGANVVSDANIFAGNTINGGLYGITIASTFTGGASGNNKILNNDIRDFFSSGIYIAGTYGTEIIGNTIHRPTRTTVGDFTGILVTTQKSTLLNVAKNRILNPFGGAPTSTSSFTGINFVNAAGTAGSGENNVVNNLIYNVNGNGAWTGISNTAAGYVFYLHNTVDLHDETSTSAATTRGFFQSTTSAGLFFYDNMISISRTGTGTKHAVYLSSALLAGMDNNNYYVFPLTGNNYTGFRTTNVLTVADWKVTTNDEAASLAINPFFDRTSVINRIPGNAAVDNKGQYINIDDDINNIVRANGTPVLPSNPSGRPDIGAHEFIPPACVLPPVTGPVVLTPTSSCQALPVSLTLNIGPYGSAQTFQWQTSATQTGTYTNLGSPLITPDTTILANVTTWIRAAVTCGGTTVFTDAVQLTVFPALPAGTYTINSGQATTYTGPATGTNFQTFNAAKNAMSCGILGAVTFNVVAGTGPYVEQLILDSIKGTSPTRTITFNGNGTTLKFDAPNTSEKAVIKFKAADFITFDSLTIDATGGTFGVGVQMLNNADSNTIRKCTILTPVTTSTNFAGIVVNATDAGIIGTGNTQCDGNIFDRNTIIGGYYGATLIGNTTVGGYIANNRFTNNIVRDFYFAGIQITGTSNTLIEGNRFTRPNVTNHPGTVYGIFVTTAGSTKLVISRNRFHNFFTAAPTSTSVFYGVNHNNADATTGGENDVVNNLFYRIEHNGPAYALYNSGSDNVRYYHNTVSLDNTASAATGATAAFFQTLAAVGIDFKNNLISITRGGSAFKHGIYLGTTTSEVASDYNNFFIVPGPASFVGFNGANRITLADWRLATNKDLNSLDINPLYIDSANGNFAAGITPLNDKGTFVGVPVDILLAARPTNTSGTARPDIGAFEFNPPACVTPPVAGIATVTPNTGICLETPIQLRSTGHSPVGSMTFQWFSSANGVTYTPLSGILFGPSYDTIATTNTYYRLTVTCNGISTNSNVVQITLGDILPAGNYTISSNPTTYPGGTNFQGFQSAVTAMQCGIGGKIVFNVAAGTYNEQIRIGNIRGVTPSRTVTFQAANGVAGSANLTFDATLANNYTLKLDSTRYFIFKNLTISATNALYGRAVELATTASFDSLVTCIINSPVTTTASANLTGIYASTLKGTQNVIKGNTINNGAYGIFYTGTGVAANLTIDHVIDSNTVVGAYNFGIYTSFHKRLELTRNNIQLGASLAGSAYGIYANESDSGYLFTNNRITMNNTTSSVYGLYINASDSAVSGFSTVSNNIINGTGTNTGSLYGLYLFNSPGHRAVNNVISLSNTGAFSFGLWTNTTRGIYWNNSIEITSPSITSGIAANFQSAATANLNIRNNIFSNLGVGRALYLNSTTQTGASDYNMLYTNGTVLVQRGAPAANYNTLAAFNAGTFYDLNSIVYKPAFAATDLQPNLANPDVWAMHGRGVQIPGNNRDINARFRPTTLIAGVPDLGAYEFLPTALPTVLTATPATPAPNTTQTFMYGTDTVMKVKWGATAPPDVTGRRYSGVVPSNLLPTQDSMYFYTKLESTAGGNFPYEMQLFYLDPWQGSIPDQNQIGLGKTTQSLVNWVVGFSSRVDVRKKTIRQTGLDFFDKFTGLVNPYAPPILPDKDSSNRGRRFWVAYGHHQSMGDGAAAGAQNMVLYLSATQPTTVQVKLNGTSWTRTYTIPANTAIVTEPMPKTPNGDDARIYNEGLYNRGISIVSEEPIEAFAHTYDGATSGATMLLPVGVYGYEYVSLNSSQYYANNTYSWSLVIADRDNTVVEITPSVATRAGRPANVPFRITLNKGEIYNIMGTVSGSAGTDLTGSKFKSVPNANGDCFPIAVFGGSSRTAICNTSNGDNMISQIFPYSAWGKRYATFLTAQSTSNSNYNTNKFRVMVKDPTTVVKRNNVTLPVASLITPGNYYDFFVNSGDATTSGVYIEADKPVLVAQYLISTTASTGGANGCPGIVSPTGVGDPDMIYISPIEQGIKQAIFYNTNASAITSNYINVVIPTGGLASLKIDNQAIFTHTFPHPSLPGFTCVRQNLSATPGQHSIQSDSAFTAITYGLGNVESYGYNAGTLVKTLNALSTINNTLDTVRQVNEFTCVGSPFRITALLPLIPTTITWKFGSVPGLSPSRDTTIANPVPIGSQIINGTTYYQFSVNQTFTFAAPGLYPVQVFYSHPDVESCDNTQRDVIYIQVLPSPRTNFTINFPGCIGQQAQFIGDNQTENGITINNWRWTFHDNTTSTGRNASYTYNTAGTFNVTLRTVTPDGCIGDSTKPVIVNPLPLVNVVNDSLVVCTGTDTAFNVASPIVGTIYNWYNSPTGGTVLATGPRFVVTNVTSSAVYYVQAVSAAGCTSAIRRRVVVNNYTPLALPVVTNTGSTSSTVTFSWAAVTGATAYQVSVNGGTFITPSSGATGLTHTVTGIVGSQSTCIIVRALATITCQNSQSVQVCACNPITAVVSPDSLAICSGATATFTVQNPPVGTTYTWFNAATGGTAVGTGNPFTTPVLTSGTQYWVQPSTAAGCAGATRTRVVVSILAVLPQPVVTVSGTTATSVTFTWPAITGATGYQVSVNGGAFSAASTATTFTVSGLTSLQSTCVVVRAVAQNACQNSQSVSVCGCNVPTVAVTPTSLQVCSGSTATFNVQSPVTGSTYNWFSQATGGTSVATGTTFTTPAITNTTAYFVEQTAGTCTSPSRTRVDVTVFGLLATPVPTFVSATPNSVTFSWPQVPGATGYQVSIDNGVTFSAINPANSYTVPNLAPLQQLSIIVRAVGNIPCQTSTSAAATGRALGDQIFIPNTFTPNGDGLNDVLQVYGGVVKDVIFMVFNQWGEKIVESRDKNRLWDGMYKGKLQPVGVYIYTAKITLLDGTVVDRKGSINLVR